LARSPAELEGEAVSEEPCQPRRIVAVDLGHCGGLSCPEAVEKCPVFYEKRHRPRRSLVMYFT
jgi:hypothetical protein